ncbi:hypothetical protein EDC04DRAFT_2964449, partial [Pisolithus marmoratus]
GTVYDVPRIIGVTDHKSSDGNYVTYSTGTEASSALKIDTSLSGRYLAVSASASVSHSINKTFKREDQWAMYNFSADTYLASLNNYANLLAETALARRLEDTVAIGDGSNKDVVQDWKDFFTAWGSHVITNAVFGARFQLRFSANVTAAFNGIGTGGRFDASVKTEEQYKMFLENMQKQVSVVGGNPVINEKLTADPAHYDVFVEWASSIAEDSSITALNVVELWVLMKDASKKEVRDAAGKVLDAYNYITSHPQPYKNGRRCGYLCDTTGGEFNLLSPDSAIVPDPNNPYPSSKTVASSTCVYWGTQYFQRQTLRFYIVNDGSPISFSISHGSMGARPWVKGRAEAIIEGVAYLNNEITDNVWNTVRFYQKPVSATAASTGLELSGAARTRSTPSVGPALAQPNITHQLGV